MTESGETIIEKEKPKLLVVDDREPERIILERILSSLDIEVHTADSGKKALQSLIHHNYILILLDIQMPEMDGIETAQLIRGNAMTENVPIIFLTAYDKDEINMLQGYEVGAIDYILKPINEGILLSKVRTFLRSYLFEKEKEYEKILRELEEKNKNLIQARQEALAMMEDARAANTEAQESKRKMELQAQELLRYNRELEQFAYVATHDLRAPLINLDGFVKLFVKKGFVTQENKSYFSRIENSVDRLKTTMHDLIEVITSRKNAEINISNVKFSTLVFELVSDLELEIQHSGAEIDVDFSQAPEINYCLSNLKSILLNLMTNAIKYRSSKRDLKIVIETRKLETGNGVCIVFRDNGVGIDPDKKDRVFELFQRLCTDVPGKGMGLYITKSQIESLGGSIEVDSEVDVGTTFYINLKELQA
ncbi:Phytochrome-like protein cph1 [Thalassocella blandensis]|nr:Phytochrome-like protein cph1 [Thalassocella blandensis]